jgi:hypothetical protein
MFNCARPHLAWQGHAGPFLFGQHAQTVGDRQKSVPLC